MQFPDGPATVKGSQCHKPLRYGGRGIKGDEPKSGDLPEIILCCLEYKVSLGEDLEIHAIFLAWIFLFIYLQKMRRYSKEN